MLVHGSTRLVHGSTSLRVQASDTQNALWVYKSPCLRAHYGSDMLHAIGICDINLGVATGPVLWVAVTFATVWVDRLEIRNLNSEPRILKP